MAATNTNLLALNGRPCIITGGFKRRPSNPKWKKWNSYTSVRYLDGQLPATDDVPAGKLKATGKPMRRAEVLIWNRVAELTAAGMEAQRAKEQATAELSKGILVEERPF